MNDKVRDPSLKHVAAIVLAAGEGKRFGAKERSKVTEVIGGVPLIIRTLKNLKEFGIRDIVVVVGFAKESVQSLLDSSIKTVEQKRRLGTGDAVRTALRIIPQEAKDVLVMNGDDSYLISPDILQRLYYVHSGTNSEVTLLSVIMDNPTGIGRIIRNKQGQAIDIIEERDLDAQEKTIKEINTGCYIFSGRFLRKYIEDIPKNPDTGEYYITCLIERAASDGQKVETLTLRDFKWRGVNTQEELEEARKIELK